MNLVWCNVSMQGFIVKGITDVPPNCITSNCKTSNCIKELTLNYTFIKIIVPRQIFSFDFQYHIMSYKTTYGIGERSSVYRKHSKILIFHFWRWPINLHSLLIVYHRQNQSCTFRRFVCIVNINFRAHFHFVDIYQDSFWHKKNLLCRLT